MKTTFDIHHLKALHSIYWLISEEDKRMWCAYVCSLVGVFYLITTLFRLFPSLPVIQYHFEDRTPEWLAYLLYFRLLLHKIILANLLSFGFFMSFS